jgi:hypothetical protein
MRRGGSDNAWTASTTFQDDVVAWVGKFQNDNCATTAVILAMIMSGGCRSELQCQAGIERPATELVEKQPGCQIPEQDLHIFIFFRF